MEYKGFGSSTKTCANSENKAKRFEALRYTLGNIGANISKKMKNTAKAVMQFLSEPFGRYFQLLHNNSE